jgi:hypothetical protein
MVEHRHLEDGGDVWTSERGELAIRRPSPSIVQTVVRGHFEFPFVPAIMMAVHRAFLPGHPVHVFHDWAQVRQVGRLAELRLLLWIPRTLSDLDSLHLLLPHSSPRIDCIARALSKRKLCLESERWRFERAIQTAIAYRIVRQRVDAQAVETVRQVVRARTAAILDDAGTPSPN